MSISQPVQSELELPTNTPPSQGLEGDTPAWRQTIIKPRRGWIAVDWGEIWQFRELLYFLTWRDIKVRYKQAVLGVAWAILQPVVQMVLFTIILGKLAGMQERLQGTTPYTIWVLVGLLPWQVFAVGVGPAALSLVNNQNLLTKIYLPRLFVPTAPIGGALLDMAVGLLILIGLLVGYNIAGYPVIPGFAVAMIIPLLVLTLLASLGAGYLFSAMTVAYRDVRFVLPFASQLLMWLSFVQIPVNVMDHHPIWRLVLSINPMLGLLGGFRAAILNEAWMWPELAVSSASALGLFLLGVFYFRKTERRFADIA